ncbi:hypothetical protein [Nocardioides zeae]
MSLRSSAGGPVGLIASGFVVTVVGGFLAAAMWPGEMLLYGGATVETGSELGALVGASIAFVGTAVVAVGVVFLGVYLGVSQALEERDEARS